MGGIERDVSLFMDPNLVFSLLLPLLLLLFSQTETLGPVMSPHSYGNIHTHTRTTHTVATDNSEHTELTIIFSRQKKKSLSMYPKKTNIPSVFLLRQTH